MTDTNQDYPKNNIGRELIPLKIVNQTKRGNLYFYLVGTSDTDTPEHHWYYLSDVNGDVTLCTPTGGEETSYSLPLSGTETVIQMPRLAGIRIYFSFDKKLNLTVPENGIPMSPAGWLQDSNFQTLFDWVEATWVTAGNDMTLGANTTQVDMLGLPFGFSLNGFDDNHQPITPSTGFVRGGERNQIMNALKQAPAPWNKLVISDETTGEDARIISPYHGMELDLFPRSQLDDYIEQVWAKYTTETLTTSAEDVTFTGQVKEGNLVFTDGAGNTITFPKPTGFMVYSTLR